MLASATWATFQIAYLLTTGDRSSATAVTVHSGVTTDGRPARLPMWLRELATGPRPGGD